MSDADAAVALLQTEQWEPLAVRVLPVDTNRPARAVIAAVRDRLDDGLRRS